jgi:hypothetical protein
VWAYCFPLKKEENGMSHRQQKRRGTSRPLIFAILITGVVSWAAWTGHSLNTFTPTANPLKRAETLHTDGLIPTAEHGTLRAALAPGESARVRVSEAYGKLPLSFEANRGQTNSKAAFIARGRGYNLFLASGEAVLALGKPLTQEASEQKMFGRIAAKASTGKAPRAQATALAQAVIRMQVRRANAAVVPKGLDELSGRVNYSLATTPNAGSKISRLTPKSNTKGYIPVLIWFITGRKGNWNTISSSLPAPIRAVSNSVSKALTGLN